MSLNITNYIPGKDLTVSQLLIKRRLSFHLCDEETKKIYFRLFYGDSTVSSWEAQKFVEAFYKLYQNTKFQAEEPHVKWRIVSIEDDFLKNEVSWDLSHKPEFFLVIHFFLHQLGIWKQEFRDFYKDKVVWRDSWNFTPEHFNILCNQFKSLYPGLSDEEIYQKYHFLFKKKNVEDLKKPLPVRAAKSFENKVAMSSLWGPGISPQMLQEIEEIILAAKNGQLEKRERSLIGAEHEEYSILQINEAMAEELDHVFNPLVPEGKGKEPMYKEEEEEEEEIQQKKGTETVIETVVNEIEEKEKYDTITDTCGMCQKNPKNVLFLPCLHVYICVACKIETFKRFDRKCPLCKSDVSDTMDDVHV